MFNPKGLNIIYVYQFKSNQEILNKKLNMT